MSRPRKKDSEKKDVRSAQRYTADQWGEIERACSLAGMKPSAFIRGAVLSQVRDINSKVRKVQERGE
jgi:hypothetical protein